MKKCLVMLLSITAFFVTFIMLGTVAYAQQSEDIPATQLGKSGTYYSYNSSTKTLTIGGRGAMPDFTNTSGSPTSQPWFLWRSDGSIENIVVEDGVTVISRFAFYGVTATNVSIPDTVTRLDSYAFACNSALTNVDLANADTIANNCFYDCTSLEKIEFSKSVEYIGESAFENCTSLDSVTFENMSMNVSISRYVFVNCPNLKYVSLPRYASIDTYAFGFKTKTAGDIYDDFKMAVFRDSKAYIYCQKSFVGFELLYSMNISEGEEYACAYFEDSLDEKITYTFTPSATAEYTFNSSGGVDVDCVLYDSAGNVIAESKDISKTDLNFSITRVLNEGENYSFVVSSCHSSGEYSLLLMPTGFDHVSINWYFEISALDINSCNIDVLSLIRGSYVNFVYNSGYIYNMPFEEGAQYLGMTLHYVGALNDIVECGDNVDYITVGDEQFPFTIHVNHGYRERVVNPTVYEGGYTEYTCKLCGDKYIGNYTNKRGRNVTGQIRVMSSPNGDYIKDSFVAYSSIYNYDGRFLGEVDENGCFSVDNAYQYITISPGLSNISRVVYLPDDTNDLGDIPIINCDFNYDGYVNAKDYHMLNSIFGEYDTNDDVMRSLDINKNGEIDYGDWEYVSSFLTYGKLDESIYNY